MVQVVLFVTVHNSKKNKSKLHRSQKKKKTHPNNTLILLLVCSTRIHSIVAKNYMYSKQHSTNIEQKKNTPEQQSLTVRIAMGIPDSSTGPMPV